eukprot:Hpha_TRINITY_DN14903_c1_g2::TRINITY_DN14903_c1_g2_i1::g.144621::m.144621/K11252/H2B; histone H2B
MVATSDAPKRGRGRPAGTGGKKKKYTRSYRTSIKKVLKDNVTVPEGQKQPRISSKALTVANFFAEDLFERIATESGKLLKHSKKKTLSARCLQASIRLVLPSELAKHALQAGAKALAKVAVK